MNEFHCVHREIGVGLLETVYEIVLVRELQDRRLTGCKLGYLLNFGDGLMKFGLTSMSKVLKKYFFVPPGFYEREECCELIVYA
ncbi:MAG: hypothetical protein NTY00_13060 [Deltaproteobacteria bacterium]|nr:hypothetical protein [Deltaproteobacteria bacterium]